MGIKSQYDQRFKIPHSPLPSPPIQTFLQSQSYIYMLKSVCSDGVFHVGLFTDCVQTGCLPATLSA